MDKILKDKWVTALRSGDYKQGTMQFKNKIENTYCCLGVLCEVAQVPIELPNEDDSFTDNYDFVIDIVGEGNTSTLWKKNDGSSGERQHSFLEIADYIDQNL